MVKTLYIGLGGFGIDVVKLFRLRMRRFPVNGPVYFVGVDSDNKSLFKLSYGNIPTVSTALENTTIQAYVDKYQEYDIENWLPTTPSLLSLRVKALHGSRVSGRLGFFDAMKTGNLHVIETVIDEMMYDDPSDTRIRVVIVTSLSGGTGSGMYIQMALWVRRYLQERWNTDGEFFGFFTGSEMFINSFSDLPEDGFACKRLRANAYAALKELEILSNLKTGAIPPLERKIYLDGLFDSSQKEDVIMPIFDEVYVYDGKQGNDEHLFYHSHVVNVTMNMYMRLHKDDIIKPAILFNMNGLRMSALNVSFAEYPEEEVVRSIAIKSFKKLVDAYKNTDTSERVERCAESFVDGIEQKIMREIYGCGCFVNRPETSPDEFERDGKAYIIQRLQHIYGQAYQLLGQATDICGNLANTIIPTDHNNIDYTKDTIFSLFCECIPDEEPMYLSPDTVKGRLTKLKEHLDRVLFGAREDGLFTFYEEPDGLKKFSAQDVEPSDDTPYPILVWEKNKPEKSDENKQFVEDYLKWFEEYCRLFEERCYKTVYGEIVNMLFSKLSQEADNMLKALEEYRVKMNELCIEEWDINKKRRYNKKNILVRSSEQVEKRLEAFVHPYENIGGVNEGYLTGFAYIYCNDKQPEKKKDTPYCRKLNLTYAFRDTVDRIEYSIFNSDSDIVSMEVIKALKEEAGEEEFENALSELGKDMLDLVQQGFERFCTGNAASAKWSEIYFGVSGECEYVDEVREFVNYNTLIDDRLDKKLMWCVKIAQGVNLRESLVMLQEPAYRDDCIKFVSDPSDTLGAHIDKRWTLWLNGVFLDY